jgi:hypothetical protein
LTREQSAKYHFVALRRRQQMETLMVAKGSVFTNPRAGASALGRHRLLARVLSLPELPAQKRRSLDAIASLRVQDHGFEADA